MTYQDRVFTSSITVPLQGPIIPAGSRIRAKLMSDQAGVTVGITIFGHRY